MEEKYVWIPVKVFAKMKGITPQAVYQGIERGLYEGKKRDGYQLLVRS